MGVHLNGWAPFGDATMPTWKKLKRQAILGELRAIEFFIHRDFEVYKQYTGKESADLIVMKNGIIYRVECKSTSARTNTNLGWKVTLVKNRHNTKTTRVYKFEDWKHNIDLLSVYIEPKDQIIMFHKEEIKDNTMLSISDEMMEVRKDDDFIKYEGIYKETEEE